MLSNLTDLLIGTPTPPITPRRQNVRRPRIVSTQNAVEQGDLTGRNISLGEYADMVFTQHGDIPQPRNVRRVQPGNIRRPQQNMIRQDQQRLEEQRRRRRNIMFEIHYEFENVNTNKLKEIIGKELNVPNDADIMEYLFKDFKDDKTFDFIYNLFDETIKEHPSEFPSEKYLENLKKIISNIKYYVNNENPDEKEYLREILARVLIFVFAEPSEKFQIQYTKDFIVQCSCAYSEGTNIDNCSDNDLSCTKGMYERIFYVLKDILLTYCLGNANSTECKPVYKEILKDVFNVNLENAIQLDKNELIQRWNQEHLENDEFLQANNLNEGNPNRLSDSEREEFLRNDFIEFMGNQYKEQGTLTPRIEEMIKNEANQLNQSGVFRNMYFGGKSKRKNKNKNKTKKNKINKKNKTHKKYKKSHKIYKRKNNKKSKKIS